MDIGIPRYSYCPPQAALARVLSLGRGEHATISLARRDPYEDPWAEAPRRASSPEREKREHRRSWGFEDRITPPCSICSGQSRPPG